MKKYEEIQKFIDNTADIYPAYILKQLKNENTLKFILKIIADSDKGISEAVFILLAVIRYIFKNGDAFVELEESDSFQEYIKENSDIILKLSIEKSVQGNMPERALPILEIIKREIDIPLINIIELGASFGLIGRCLLNPVEIIKKKERYFSSNQLIPKNLLGINKYLGIELDPPDKEWLFACIWEEGFGRRLKNFIEDIQTDERFELIKNNAFGFSKLESVKNFCNEPGKIIIITSFLLYQFDDERKRILVDEILKFSKSVNGHWINQAVRLSLDSGQNEFFISLDNKKIIELPDDTCLNWRWIDA